MSAFPRPKEGQTIMTKHVLIIGPAAAAVAASVLTVALATDPSSLAPQSITGQPQPHAVASGSWLPPIGSTRDLHPQSFIHA